MNITKPLCAALAVFLAAPAAWSQESALPKAETAPPTAVPAPPLESPPSATEPSAVSPPAPAAAPAPAATPSAAPAAATPDPNAGQFAVVPFAAPSYSPETSLMVGGAGIFVYRFPEGSGRRDSQVVTALAASVKKQVTLLVQPDVYLWNDRVQIGGTLAVSRFPNSFYGIGNNSPGVEEKFTPVTFDFALSPKLRLVKGLYLGPEARFQYTNITDREQGGLLLGNGITGASGGRIVQVGVSGFYDTRDNTIYPHEGHIVRLVARTALTGLGSDFSYRMMSLDARKYFRMPWENHVLAVQALFEMRDGAPPFYDLGLLGGDQTMRGYFQGQYRDRNYLTAQVEYRLPLFWRLGAVAFASAGQVARTLDDIRPSDVKFAAGGGLRLAPLKDVPVNIRLDVAYGDDPRFYVNVGEAF